MKKIKLKMVLWALVLSILIHFTLAAILSTGGSGDGKEGEGGAKQNLIKMKILDKVAETESKKEQKKLPESKSSVVVPKEKELPPEQKVVDHKCVEFYEGIGVQFYGYKPGCVVQEVGKGYPADRAGIQVEDIIVTSDPECPGRGATGTTLTLRISRGTKIFTKTLVREKICTLPPEE